MSRSTSYRHCRMSISLAVHPPICSTTLNSKYAGSWTDTINDVDWIRQTNGGLVVRLQHVLSVAGFRRARLLEPRQVRVSFDDRFLTPDRFQWLGYDFNYTWSHAIDNGSGSESSGGTNVPNAFCTICGMGPADYDARHLVNANAVVELPVGKASPCSSTPRRS